MRLRWIHIVGLLSVVSVVGCGEGSGTMPVTGSVMLDGVPMEGASVVLAPKDKEGQAAAGFTDASGKFTVSCQAGTGALPGSYNVAISKPDPEAVKAQQFDTAADVDPEDYDAIYNAAEKAGAGPFGEDAPEEVRDLLPAKYKNPMTSGLTAEVKAEGETVLPPFELTTK